MVSITTTEIIDSNNSEIADGDPEACIGEENAADETKSSLDECTTPIFNFDTPSRMQRIQSAENVSSYEYSNNLHRLRRSLKLLGFSPEEFGIVQKSDKMKIPISRPCSAMSIKKAMERVGPTFTTQLQSRTIQLEELRNLSAASNETPKLQEEISREQLSRAVYEEWYFQKVKETMNKIKKEQREKEETLQEKIKKEQEIREKCEQNYQIWAEIKRKKLKKLKLIEKQKQERVIQEQKSKEEKMSKAYLAWKEEKDKKLKEEIIKKNRELKELLEKKENEKKEKDINANKVYTSWKSTADKKVNSTKAEEIKKKKLLEEEKRRKKEEKMKDNLTAFNAWKGNKDVEIKNKKRLDPSQSSLRRAKSESRLQESQVAFEDWLLQSVERSSINTVMHEAPWKPV